MPDHENRFDEVIRKSREARARMNAAQRAKAVADEERANALREEREPAFTEGDSTPPKP